MSIEVDAKPKIFTVDCSQPAKDNLISASELETYLQEKIKCHIGKKEKLLNIAASGNEVKVFVTGEFIKKVGLRFQLRRFLNMKRLRAFIKVYSSGTDAYEFRYINVEEAKEE